MHISLVKQSYTLFLIANNNKVSENSALVTNKTFYSFHTHTAPVSERGGGKKRDPGNEVGPAFNREIRVQQLPSGIFLCLALT